METYLIAGLGNPDKKYEGTRHNAGFMAIDRLAYRLGTAISDRKFKGLTSSAFVNGTRVILLKPLTYMNLSGDAVIEAANYYNIEPDQIIVICDDINFACGRMRVRPSGSAGGHNGLKNIIARIGSEDFKRIRLGVGAKADERMDLKDHVLGRFSKEDAAIMDRVYDAAADAALCIMDKGTSEAMNRFNGLNLSDREESD